MHILEERQKTMLFKFAYLLWRHVESQRTHVHLLVGVNAGHDEEDTRAPGPAGKKTTQTEDDHTFVLLNNFDGEAKRKWNGDKDQ